MLTSGRLGRVTVGARAPPAWVRALSQASAPFSLRSKVVAMSDAVSLIRSSDTVFMSGFVTQGIPDSVLKALERRFLDSGSAAPRDLTLVWYGGGDPKGVRGTNRLRHAGLLKRCISSHFGQSPDLHPAILGGDVEAYSLPMGSIARMVRATASGTPGHFTKVGLGTFVDPRHGGGKVNAATTEDLVELVQMDGQDSLRYKPLRLNVGIIRATTADGEGNLSIEHESVSPDILLAATAVRASGGVVIAQVDRVAEAGSLALRGVKVPGALVDCVVLAEPEDVGMSFYTKFDPSWNGEIIAPKGSLPTLDMSPRKIIARRAAMELRPRDIVNLGIGMPEGVASVAAEERILEHITLTTEAGMFGGLGASGHDFGPAANASAMLDTSQQFDFYNGGGLDVAFLGAAEVGPTGDVNVSKLGPTSITGPGGFIDITQSTHKVVFLGTFTKKGLTLDVTDHGARSEVRVATEGSIPMFRKSVQQVTFNADQARAHAQSVHYITERAVFRLVPGGLELLEVAPGLDLDADVLAHMEFEPIVDRAKVKVMDARLLGVGRMKMQDDFFQAASQFAKRFHVRPGPEPTLFLDLSGLSVTRSEDLVELAGACRAELERLTNGGRDKLHCVSTFEGSDIRPDLASQLERLLVEVDARYLKSVVRIAGKAFLRSKVAQHAGLLSNHELWEQFSDGREVISRKTFVEKAGNVFQMSLTQADVLSVLGDLPAVSRLEFDDVLERLEECVQAK